MFVLIACTLGGLIAGGGLGVLAHNYSRNRLIRLAKDEAQDIIDEAKAHVDLKNLEEKERIQEIEMELWTKVEPEMLKVEGRIEDLQEIATEKKEKADAIVAEEKKKLQEKEKDIRQQETNLKKLQSDVQKVSDLKDEKNNQLVEKLTEKLSTTKDEFKNTLKIQLEEEAARTAARLAQEIESDAKEYAESDAKRILSLVIDRFARPYCPERGIGAVNFPDVHVRKLFCDPEGLNIKTTQEVCGCDIVVQEGFDMVGVAGFDPVRRELTRRTLERIFKERKSITPDFIRKIAENQKKELFKNIKHDGDQLAKELKLEGLHPEVRQMMGSLRYRYSFTQNQYFHCGEVGWLAGLIGAELGLDTKKARRIGMLHDIGKSMDHTMDGGHAVIGADFIQARGEKDDVVHAVKAHHFDEQPNSDLAFILIAADAISGARPGARRSTIESYNQKVSELQDIARSFDGVTDCYVLSGGRECRVMVNGKKIDDTQALEISKNIAHRIEEECSYPGSIKVVVVRETLVTEQTRKELA